MNRNYLKNREELNETLKNMYGWYDAIKIEDSCHVRADELIAALHNSPRKVVQNINDGKDYYIVDFEFNRWNDEHTAYCEIGIVLVSDIRNFDKQLEEIKDDTERVILWNNIFSKDNLYQYTKWCTAHDLYDAGRLQSALDKQ